MVLVSTHTDFSTRWSVSSRWGGKAALKRPNEKRPEDAEIKELRKRVAHLERALGRKTYDLEIAGKLLRDWE